MVLFLQETVLPTSAKMVMFSPLFVGLSVIQITYKMMNFYAGLGTRNDQTIRFMWWLGIGTHYKGKH